MLMDRLIHCMNYLAQACVALLKFTRFQFTFALTNPIKLQPWEFLHSDVKQGELLGQGAFGEVRAGALQLKTGENVEVAIKVVSL